VVQSGDSEIKNYRPEQKRGRIRVFLVGLRQLISGGETPVPSFFPGNLLRFTL
jgi:hypothetical protein